MHRSDYVLAVMAGVRVPMTPVQVQKLFFILDQKISALTGGKRFAFTPYNYGPFDPQVYSELDNLIRGGLASVDTSGATRRYYLTARGHSEGSVKFRSMIPAAQAYVRDLADWISKLSFQQLVSAVYAQWPEMKANSIFRG